MVNKIEKSNTSESYNVPSENFRSFDIDPEKDETLDSEEILQIAE
jgi:hypothetical protein